MKLTFLGRTLDETKDHNLVMGIDHPHGFKTTVTFRRSSIFSKNPKWGKSELVLNNCSNINVMYLGTVEKPEARILFESNTHQKKGLLSINDIESVVIERADIRTNKF